MNCYILSENLLCIRLQIHCQNSFRKLMSNDPSIGSEILDRLMRKFWLLNSILCYLPCKKTGWRNPANFKISKWIFKWEHWETWLVELIWHPQHFVIPRCTCLISPIPYDLKIKVQRQWAFIGVSGKRTGVSMMVILRC